MGKDKVKAQRHHRPAMLMGCAFSALAIALAGGSPVAAQCVAAPGQITCSPEGNPYQQGIRAGSQGDLNAVLEAGVEVQTDIDTPIAVDLSAAGNVTMLAADNVLISAQGEEGTTNPPRESALPAAAAVRVSSGGLAIVALDRVEASGDNMGAVVVDTAGGATVTANSVSAFGRLSTGLALAGSGPVNFALGEVTVAGEGAMGIAASTVGSITGTIGTLTLDGESIVTDGGTDTAGNALPPVLTGGLGADLSATGGDIRLSIGTLTNNGDRAGILAESSGGGIAVDVTGDVLTRGPALDLTSATILYVTNPANPTGDPIAQPIAGIGDAALHGRVNVTVAAGAALTSIDNPAIRSSATLGTTIVNIGRIERFSYPGDLAIEISGGPATITNTGEIVGRLRLTGNADTFDNAGTYSFTDVTDFDNGGDVIPAANANLGSDVFNNSGTVKLANFPLAHGEPNVNKDVLFGQLANLEVFNNSGLIDLRSGAAGDELRVFRTGVNVPNGSPIPQGNYVGSGNATLAVDLEFQETTGLVDRLNLQNATGQTEVVVNVIGTAAPNILVSLPVVYVADGSTGTFTLSPLQVDDIRYSLRFNPTINAFALYGSVPDSLIRLTKLPGDAQSLWYRSNDMVSSHLRQERDRRWTDAEPGSRLWFQVSGDVATRHETYTETVNYVPTAGLDLTQRQETYIGQVGFESQGPENGNNGVVFGATLSYGKTTARFRSASDRYGIDQLGGGAHVSWLVGPAYVTGSANYSKHAIDMSNASSRLTTDTASGKSIGAAIETGFRLGNDSFFVEPSAGFTYVVTKIEGLGLRKGRFGFDEFTGNLGSAGIRVGGRMDWGDREIVYYAGGQALHEYAGNDYADVAIGGPAVDIPIVAPGTYGKATAGINIVTDGRANLFAEANGLFGGSYSGGGGKVGVRIGF